MAVAGPKDLFELAELARLNGKYRESAEALNKLRRNYRTDPRAGLAAFELGRLRMDSIGDWSGAIDALRDATLLSPNAYFREDAESRLVQLYARQGALDQCRSAKKTYLAHFPEGAASKVVRQLCDP
jgi:tetratricopeptide (TPR) repeat protein